MSNVLKWSLKKAIIAFAAMFCVAVIISAFLAPALSGGFNAASNFLYEFLHHLCKVHGSDRFLILSHPIAICARCMGAYITAAITLYLYIHKFKMNKVVYIIIGALAIGEIAAEYFNLFVTNDFIMLISGLFLGAFLGMTLIKILDWLEGKRGW